MKKIVDIRDESGIDIYVDKQLVLQIGQVSDDEVINLYFYPQDGNIFESQLNIEEPEHGCTHELLVNREVKEDEQ